MTRAEFALFLSGLFFGGAVDHVILALRRSEHTPYGRRVGIRGNWLLAGFDLAIAMVGYIIHSYLGSRSKTLSL